MLGTDGGLELEDRIVGGAARLLEDLDLLRWCAEMNALSEQLLDFLVQGLEGGVRGVESFEEASPVTNGVDEKLVGVGVFGWVPVDGVHMEEDAVQGWRRAWGVGVVGRLGVGRRSGGLVAAGLATALVRSWGTGAVLGGLAVGRALVRSWYGGAIARARVVASAGVRGGRAGGVGGGLRRGAHRTSSEACCVTKRAVGAGPLTCSCH